MIRYFFGAYFKQFSLSPPDANKNKGVAETAFLRGFIFVSQQAAVHFPFYRQLRYKRLLSGQELYWLYYPEYKGIIKAELNPIKDLVGCPRKLQDEKETYYSDNTHLQCQILDFSQEGRERNWLWS